MSTGTTAQQPEVNIEQLKIIDYALSQTISGVGSFEPDYPQQLPQRVNLRNRISDQLVRRIQGGQSGGFQRLDVNSETDVRMIRLAVTKVSHGAGQPFSQAQMLGLLSQIDQASGTVDTKTHAASTMGGSHSTQPGKVGG